MFTSCYSTKQFVFEDAYQDDEYDYLCFYYNKDMDDLDSILSEDFVL